MRNEILKWAKEQKHIINGPTLAYDNGYMRAMNDLIDKINSIPVPSVEGYLKGKIYYSAHYRDIVEGSKIVTPDNALTALQELKEDCDNEWDKKLADNAWGWIQKCNELKAEVERLKSVIKELDDRTLGDIVCK